MQSEQTAIVSPLHLAQAAQDFAAEVAGSAERKKRTIPSPAGLQLFLLYVRVHGYVPFHQVSGAITVQTLLGDARLTAEGHTHDLPTGSMICLAAEIPHDVSANSETVLLVTHALRD